MQYITKQNDTLDLISWQTYGTETVIYEILALNNNLAELGPVLDAGLVITLPDELPERSKSPDIRVWN